jgi:hypothetical protein
MDERTPVGILGPLGRRCGRFRSVKVTGSDGTQTWTQRQVAAAFSLERIPIPRESKKRSLSIGVVLESSRMCRR